MKFTNFVIDEINKTKQTWINERIFVFKGISGLSKNPSINAYNENTSKNVVIGSRPGWRGLECDSKFYVFSLVAHKVIFGTIIHRYQNNPATPLYKCISFKFNENIEFPFFDEMLKCLNKRNIFLPMNYPPTTQTYSSTLTYQSSWKNHNYMSICCKNGINSINIMKNMIDKVKTLMPFIGNSMLVEAPEVESIVEIYSIGGSGYSTKIYSLNHHPHIYELSEEMFNYLSNQLNVLAKTDSPIKISINMDSIMNTTYSNKNPFFVISEDKIIGFCEIDWKTLIKKKPTNFVNPFIEEINSLAPNIISAQDSFSYLYCFLGNDFHKLSKNIQQFLETNFKNDLIVKSIPLQKVFYGKDIDYDAESKRIKDEINQNKSKIKSIRLSEKQYKIKKQKYEIDKEEYPRLMDEYYKQILIYNQELNLKKQMENELKDLKQQIKLQKTQETAKEPPEQNIKNSKRSKKSKKQKNPPTEEQKREKELSEKIRKMNLKQPKKPAEPKKPTAPDFYNNKQIIKTCNNEIERLENHLRPINKYYQTRDNDLVKTLLIRNSISKISTCGTEGCVIQFKKGFMRNITDTEKWKCDLIKSYEISIKHHVLHCMTPIEFKSIIKDVSAKFGMFVGKIGDYIEFESFGQLGYIMSMC